MMSCLLRAEVKMIANLWFGEQKQVIFENSDFLQKYKKLNWL